MRATHRPAATPRATTALRAAAFVAAALFALLLIPAAAAAFLTHAYNGTSFGPDGTASTSFASPTTLTVDEASRDVYVVDQGATLGAGDVQRFDSSHQPAPFSALGTNAIAALFGGEVQQVAVDPAGPAAGDVFVPLATNTGHSAGNPYQVEVYGSDGSLLGSLIGPSDGTSTSACGLATDPSGHLYVGRLSAFTNSGAFGQQNGIGVYTPSASPPIAADLTTSFRDPVEYEHICQLAVDPASGDVYALNPESVSPRTVRKFTSTGTDLGLLGPSGVYALAVDPANGHLFLDRGTEVVELDSAGNRLGSFPSEGASQGIAVDPVSGDVYLSDSATGHVDVFGPGIEVPAATTEAPTGIGQTSAIFHGTVNAESIAPATCSFQYTTAADYEAHGFKGSAAESIPCEQGPFSDSSPHAVSATPHDLHPNTDYRYRLIATNANGADYLAAVEAFTTLGPPIVDSTSSTEVTASSANLEATLEPRNFATTYHFEYMSEAEYEANGETFAGATAIPVPDAKVAGTAGQHEVSQHITGLQPETTYRYRLVAKSVQGTTAGVPATFIAQPASESILPDGRAWELVSPPDKGGAVVYSEEHGENTFSQASLDGAAVSFISTLPLPGGAAAPNANTNLSRRTPSGWRTESLDPAHPPAADGSQSIASGYGFLAFSLDLSRAFLATPFTVGDTSTPNGSGPHLYWRDPSGAFHLIASASQPHAEALHGLGGESADGTRVAFRLIGSALLPEANNNAPNLYELIGEADGGESLRLLSLLPNGSAPPPSDELAFGFKGNNFPPANVVTPGQRLSHVVSADGSRVFWEDATAERLYVRENADRSPSAVSGTAVDGSQCTEPEKACTLQIDAPQGGPDPGGFGHYWTASADGTAAFFTDCQRLTPDSTAEGLGGHSGCQAGEAHPKGSAHAGDLYRYDIAAHRLTDLTTDPAEEARGGAGVVGVLGASADGTYVYFAARGALAPGATHQACSENNGYELAEGCNLYLWHDDGSPHGTISLIARLPAGPDDGHALNTEAWSPFDFVYPLSSVSANGRLAFLSLGSLTGYDNVPPPSRASMCREGNKEFSGAAPNAQAGNPAPCAELYVYDPQTARLSCASCNPTGARPLGMSFPPFPPSISGVAPSSYYQSRWFSADGSRLFFDSEDALAARDTNGVIDVYEWEAPGTGSCVHGSPLDGGGCVRLISSGTSPTGAQFADASASGDDVFFTTAQRLAPTDVDQSPDLYDAHVCTTASPCFPPPPPPPVECAGDACQPPAEAPPALTPGSWSFQGPGNEYTRPSASPAHAKKTRKKSHTRKRRGRNGRNGKKRRRGKTSRNVRADNRNRGGHR